MIQKVITLHQPWASLIMLGLKNYETRSWPCPIKHRGPLLIHASKKVVPLDNIVGSPEFYQIVRALLDKYGRCSDMPTGAILGQVDVVGAHKTEEVKDEISPLELACGDYADGRFAWELANITPFDEPIPAKGKQGLWNFDYVPGVNVGKIGRCK